jgi:hypothetical protein
MAYMDPNRKDERYVNDKRIKSRKKGSPVEKRYRVSFPRGLEALAEDFDNLPINAWVYSFPFPILNVFNSVV